MMNVWQCRKMSPHHLILASFFSLLASIEREVLLLWTVLRKGFLLLWLPKELDAPLAKLLY